MTRAIALTLCLLPLATKAETEAYYRDVFCKDIGISEFVLPDKTRVDCLTFGVAIEVDFARKWAEAVGQALHYARMTGRYPGIAVIVENVKDCKYLQRLLPITSMNRPWVKVWQVGPYAYQCRL